ncbi:GntR family transcriptional regulator [Paenibacillus validus]|uniref:FCD domain-containing protein n=2 Tax=Paenibacillus validus TaxID=44253 RepID=A0A7X3CSY6_9BACL|nr:MULTISPECIES: GntR family transcriptional regulator [Paenibacillus]MED4599251.1 GntR family transcriptional regulator [Paenibacillus validus]MED4605024.1 GntR family transcriptional regulator [Paenibacillus validus]MUG72280.1 FCD domain-containing protein [Paenibacillus validus]
MSAQMETAYVYIKERILNNTYKPSQKLTEIQLADEIGVSRNTIKKALLKLEQENLVEMEENKGATIKSFTLEEILNYLEIREALEVLTIKSAIHQMSDADIKELGQILKDMEIQVQNGNFTQYSALNKQFHNIIYKSSKNIQSVELINLIKTQLSRVDIRSVLVPGRNQQSLEEHTRIFQALKNRDEKEAEEAMRAHISNVRRTIRDNHLILL